MHQISFDSRRQPLDTYPAAVRLHAAAAFRFPQLHPVAPVTVVPT